MVDFMDASVGPSESLKYKYERNATYQAEYRAAFEHVDYAPFIFT